MCDDAEVSRVARGLLPRLLGYAIGLALVGCADKSGPADPPQAVQSTQATQATQPVAKAADDGVEDSTPAPSADPVDFERKNLEDHDAACGSTEPATKYLCEFDTDCVVCHDGSACGSIMDRTRAEKLGDDCERDDSAQCEMSRPRCCDGHCVRASH